MWGIRRESPPGDEAHVLHAARDDLTQFAAIYERYVDRIYAYCSCRVGEQDAEDVTSQVFIKAMDALGGYRGGSVAAWLFRIARSCVVDHLRYRRTPVSLDAHDIDPPAHGLDIVDQVADREQIAALGAIITQLFDEEQINLLTLKLAGELNATQIAEVVGKSPVAVRVQLSRMLRRIRARYAEIIQEQAP